MTQEQFHLISQLVQAGLAKVSGDAQAAMQGLQGLVEPPPIVEGAQAEGADANAEKAT